MPEVKLLKAKKTIKLDCGCLIPAQQAFMVTRTFTCLAAATELLQMLMSLHPTNERQQEPPKQA
jgi:hypothetical protein